MKVAIVTEEGSKLGEVDVWASSWLEMPKDVQLDLDQAVLSGEIELVLRRKVVVWDEMVVHKRDRQKGQLPLCWPENAREAFKSEDDIDKVDCVKCLRMLAHHAVLFGNDRRAKRSGAR